MEGNRKKPVKGIQIRTLSLVLLIVSCVLYVLLIYATIHVSMKYETLTSDTKHYIECEKNASLVSDGSDYLTEQVRLCVVTGKRQYMDLYFQEIYTTQRREKALQQLEQYPASEAALGFLRNALETSNNLMEREIYAMKLISVAQGYDVKTLPEEVNSAELSGGDEKMAESAMRDKAANLVFGSYYQGVKESIESDIDFFLGSIVDRTANAQQGSASELKTLLICQRVLIGILLVLNIAAFFLIMRAVIKPVKSYIEHMKEGKTLEASGACELRYLAETYNEMCQVSAASQELLRCKSKHDPLTGLVTRESFEQLRRQLSVTPTQMALIIIDVDEFESVYDEYGSETADEVLKKVARLIEKSFRTTDFPARIGRDEFAVILMDMMPGLKSVIRNKVNAMNKVLQNPANSLPPISLSAGVAFSQKGFSSELYKSADTALGYVKEHGRCGCSFFGEHE